jgi:anti-sigma-K factor RskA
MNQIELHDLAAAYALDALDPDERRDFERHLEGCDRCQEDVASLRDGAAQLGRAAEGPEPPPELRERILAAARAEPQDAVVIPFRRRSWVFPATALAAAAAACAAVGLGIWAASLKSELNRERESAARVVSLKEGAGSVVVTEERAILVACLGAAPADKTYEAWVIADGVPRPAGLFRGGGCQNVDLSRAVKPGNTVAVTLERKGGVDRPQGDILLSADV